MKSNNYSYKEKKSERLFFIFGLVIFKLYKIYFFGLSSYNISVYYFSGSFSSVNDQVAQNTPFNQSTITGPPFTCVICNSWFYVGDKLKLHYVVNHDVYHCDICTSLFENEEERDEHGERVHHTVQCEICQDELGRHDIWFHYDQDHDAVPCFYCGVLRPKSDYEQHFITAHKCVRGN